MEYSEDCTVICDVHTSSQQYKHMPHDYEVRACPASTKIYNIQYK